MTYFIYIVPNVGDILDFFKEHGHADWVTLKREYDAFDQPRMSKLRTRVRKLVIQGFLISVGPDEWAINPKSVVA